MSLSPKLILLVVVSTFIYIGGAIWAFGGWTAFFSHPALIALTVCYFFIAALGLFTQASLSSGIREDRGNRWVLAVFGIVGISSAFVPAYTDRIDFWTFGGEPTRWIGVLLYLIGGLLRMWPVFVLGKRFSGLVAIQPGHTLVTTGIYTYIRNPSYLGLIVNAIGWALAFRSLAGILLALLYIPPLIARMHSEERLLRDQFGAEYDAYFACTWRLIPWIY